MKFKVGDKVRVRKDLEVGKDYGDHDVVEDMEKYKGKEFIIDEVRKHCYRLKNENWYYWTDEMLELVEEGEKNNMNIEELNKEYKDKMDILMKEYKEKVKELEGTKEEPFIKEKQDYFYIDGCFDIHESKYYNHKVEIKRIELGNCYPFIEGNKDKVFEKVKLIAERRKLQSEMEMFARQNNERKINWANNQEKWLIYIDYDDNHAGIDKTYNYRELINGTYFTSKEIAEKALDKFGDRIRKLYMEEE